MDDPRAEYPQRLSARRATLRDCERQHIRMGNLRLLAALAAVVLVWLSLGRHLISPWWLTAPVACFVALAIIHARALRDLALAARAAKFYELALTRLDDRWAGTGETGSRFVDNSHPYADDLDLFGPGSLFELLSTARTRSGEDTLAAWLKSAAPLNVIVARQKSVDELRPRLDLREELAVLGEDIRTGVHPEPLARWAEAPGLLSAGAARVAAAVLPVFTIAALVYLVVSGVWSPFLVMVALQTAFGLSLRPRVLEVIQSVEEAGKDLALLSTVLNRLEREPFASARLLELQEGLKVAGHAPSERIRRLARLIELIDSRHNQIFYLISLLFLWATQLAFAVEAWRGQSGPHVRQWLDAVGEIEALSALAGYAYEHPTDPFPEFVAGPPPYFDGEALGHPLLPEERMVRNDVRLAPDRRLLLISGSNMSGKSTLLRTAGINTVLAMAGAPVRARRLLLSPLAVGASIRVTDSLQGGSSRFYAEITRLRKLVDIAQGPAPLLFLLDELLNGTNSHDRRIGAEAVVRGLLDRGAIGLVTTHDLALTHIAESVAPPGVNVHFEDHLEDGRISFDYRMREGVVTKSNALALMRSIGLDV